MRTAASDSRILLRQDGAINTLAASCRVGRQYFLEESARQVYGKISGVAVVISMVDFDDFR